MEGDVITTHDLFTFKFSDEGNDSRKVKGAFEPSGIRPGFLARAEQYGLGQSLIEAI